MSMKNFNPMQHDPPAGMRWAVPVEPPGVKKFKAAVAWLESFCEGNPAPSPGVTNAYFDALTIEREVMDTLESKLNIETYRKLPVHIKAIQLTAKNIDEVAGWCNGEVKNFQPPSSKTPLTGLIIKTLEGAMFAEMGDYIIQGIEGEFYPCKPSIFVHSYEKLEETNEFTN